MKALELGSTERTEQTNSFEVIAAHAIVFAIAIRYRFPPDIPISFLVSAALLPVTFVMLRRYRGALAICVLAVIAAVCGLLLTMGQAPVGLSNNSLFTVQTWRVLGIGLVLLALLWVRSRIGTQRLILVFGLGSLVSLGITGLNPDNIWKFSLAVPVTLIALSLPWVYGHRVPQLLTVLVLAAISAFGDSRSSAGMLIVAAALTLFQRRTDGRVRQGSTAVRAWSAIGLVALVGLGAYYGVQAAILEGALGESVQARTEAQIVQSGSALVGGRPEMGAAFALILSNPVGFGAGALVSYESARIAKQGMAAIGYDPNNGYVDNYMFGYGFEVHSLLGDVWLLFGPVGAVLALTIVGYALFGLGSALSTGAAATVVVFLALRLTWDLTFSPFPSAMVLLPLALAVTLPLAVGKPPPATALSLSPGRR